MKKIMTFAILAMLLAFAGCEKEPPSGNGLFSVSKDKQVRFAPGNLEYDSINGYSFAAHQYDYGGHFGWGTGSNPTLTSSDYHDYPSFDDWGSYIDGGWRTLTRDEWKYIIEQRADAPAKRGTATVCGVHGWILLPDNFSGGTFNAGSDRCWTTNVYAPSSWSAMEAAGVLFLPAAGYRWALERDYVGTDGSYWSSTPNGEDIAYGVYINASGVASNARDYRYNGHSVRLVQDI